MLDMETLSIADNPVILSISAIAFDIDTANNLNDFKKPLIGQIRDDDDISFHCALDINDQIKKGLDFDSGTLLWHLERNNKFFMECINPKDASIAKITPESALESFNSYIHDVSANDRFYRKPIVWACGAVNDHRWLDNLFLAYKKTNSLEFRQKMCYRTIREAYDTVGGLQLPNNHDSFDDCVNQILTLQSIYKNAIDPN